MTFIDFLNENEIKNIGGDFIFYSVFAALECLKIDCEIAEGEKINEK